MVSTYYHPVIGGAEAAAQRLAEHLHQRGHQVFVITKRTSPDLPEHDAVNGVAIWRRPPIGARTALGKWLFLPRALGGLVSRRRSYDVICVIDQRGTGVVAWLAARFFGKPFIIQPQTQGTIDGRHPLKDGWRAVVHRAATWPLRSCYTRADAIACITHSIEAEGRAMGVPEARLHYLPNPVDIERFAPASPAERTEVRRAAGVAADELVFTYTGRLSREKGIRELLLAWPRVAAPGRRLLVIGPDMPGHPWDDSVWARDHVRQHALEDSVTFLGAQPHAEVARLLGAADVAVLPSHFEAHPLAAVEAMACGLPIVASNVGGVPDFVVHEENGLLVEPRDVDGLGVALVRMAEDTAFRARAGPAARRAAEPFSAKRVLERFAVLMSELSELSGLANE